MNTLELLLKKYPNEDWDCVGMSSNPNITMDIIEKYPNKPWNWNWISWNPNLTMEIIEKYPNKPWNWYYISMNPNITIDIIEKYPEKPWNGISWNQNITIDFIEKHLNKIDFSNLSKNKFTFENTRMKKKEGYLLLEKERSFHRLQNLYVINQYM